MFNANTLKKNYFSLILISVVIFFTGCNKRSDTLFILQTKDKTGIDFSNTIFESDTFNVFTYDYIYNGGGVAVADFNNDGRQDVFFTGNMVPNRLYLNDGEFEFQDVTNVANVNVPGKWNSGVTVVDINNDGWQDIYVCATMKKDSLQRGNMLFLNKGVNEDNVPVFEEAAAKYGINDRGYNVMATFFDYDRDGDLDLYILTNTYSEKVASNYLIKVNDGTSATNDTFYRNDGDGKFTNVTIEAGIVHEGYGLGLAISDVNNDGWPDIHVSNDFITNDVLYINNRNGTFSNQSSQWIAHQSQFSMGSDAADFNNDGRTDLVTMDMLPESNERKKTMINDKTYLVYINNERYHYDYQYMRNMLHLNNGVGDGVGFSEIGQLSGVFQTEWSWSALFADFDNDGLKDLAITNGYPRDITDKDFVKYRTDVGAYVSTSQLLDSVPIIKLHNYIYKNDGNLMFHDASKEWGFTQPTFSNGAAFADFDNDGDLDYVVNNINDPALIYENTSEQAKDVKVSHYLRLKLVGAPSNRNAIGAKAELYERGNVQLLENYVARGYLSSIEGILHFGLGSADKVDSVVVTWPDGNCQRFQNIKVDALDTLQYNPQQFINRKPAADQKHLFKDVSRASGILFKHEEEDKIDYNIQRTLPHKFSQSGPGVAVGDINGDGLDDAVIGGSVGHHFTVLKQQKDGRFETKASSSTEKKEEDEGLLLFDADNDGDLDLYVVSGGFESDPNSSDYQDRLYKNDGRGNFTLDKNAIPEVRSSGSCVRASDFDNDGDLDLFVGGRVVPGSYPNPAKSYILKNDNGIFNDVTESVCPDLATLGMVTDALFTDYDNDGKSDLVVVGEFLPISFFKNSDGRFVKVAQTGIENSVGWWNSIAGGDFDSDGDIDYVAGNLGLNNAYQVTGDMPLCVFAKDFDKNGSVDAILGCYIKKSLTDETKELFPVHYWDELNSQSPRFRQQFSWYKQYGKTDIHSLFKQEELTDALILKANNMASSYIENLGNGKFSVRDLPMLAQVSPINGLVVDDFNADGNADVLIIGNDYGNEVFFGRYDAFVGLTLLGDGKGNFNVSNASENGFHVRGDAKALARISGDEQDFYIATRNRDSVSVFMLNNTKPTKIIAPKPLDSWAEIVYKDGRKNRVEFYYGSGYLSQSTRKMRLNEAIKSVVVQGSNTEATAIHVKQ